MHNKCCTTCRIFNWDHAMMYLPLIVIPGFWTYSLVFMALLILVVWEVVCANHPERFFEKTNCALRCQNCKDKLCGKQVEDWFFICFIYNNSVFEGDIMYGEFVI